MVKTKPDNRARTALVEGYTKSPELLEYKLYQVFTKLGSDAMVAVHNDIITDIEVMAGGGLKKLVEEIAQSIINVSKAELLKNDSS